MDIDPLVLQFINLLAASQVDAAMLCAHLISQNA
jgi:hypothetical protein